MLYGSQNGKCEALLIALTELVKNNDPTLKMTPVGFLEALFDPENRKPSMITQIGAGTGHYKSVRIKWKNRSYKDEEGYGSDEKDCGEDAIERPHQEEPFNITQYWQRKVIINESVVKQLCEEASVLRPLPVDTRQPSQTAYAVFQEVFGDILIELNGMRAEINALLHEQLVTKLGAYEDGGTSKDFEVLNLDGSPRWGGINDLGFEYMQAEGSMTPIVVGTGNLWKATNGLKFGCCNLSGIDFGKMTGVNAPYKFYLDKDLHAAFGETGNEAVMFSPGILQFATFNEYVGNFASQIGLTHRGTFPDPKIPGLRYDLRVVEDGCAENYTVIIGLWFELFGAPAIAGLGEGDVNGVFGLVATQEEEA